MPKYKLLPESELHKLGKEFTEFLVINGIAADDWLEIKDHSKDEANQIIELFSDVVYEQILREARFLKKIHPDTIYCFQCVSEKMNLVGLKVKGQNLQNIEYLDAILESPEFSKSTFATEKFYIKSREQEIFDLLEQGAEITDGSLFKTLSLLHAES